MNGWEHREGLPNGGCDRRRIALNSDKLAAGLLDTCCRDAAHRVHHRAELAGPIDTRINVREAFSHGSLAASSRAAGVRV